MQVDGRGLERVVTMNFRCIVKPTSAPGGQGVISDAERRLGGLHG